MDKYEKLYRDLMESGTGQMICYGDSMIPILYSGCKLTFIKQKNYEIDDIVFCVIDGYVVDAHIVTKKFRTRHKTFVYEISDSHGNINGRTNLIFGKVIKAEYEDGTPTKEFN
jgi:hypothetical protein